MGIPLDEAMAALDTDYASEAYTCASDDETSRELGDNQDERCNGEMAARREKSGLGVTAKMVVGPVWRNPDVSTIPETVEFDDTHLIISVHRLRPLAHLQILQREGAGK
jgi:hypothetical protein